MTFRSFSIKFLDTGKSWACALPFTVRPPKGRHRGVCVLLRPGRWPPYLPAARHGRARSCHGHVPAIKSVAPPCATNGDTPPEPPKQNWEPSKAENICPSNFATTFETHTGPGVGPRCLKFSPGKFARIFSKLSSSLVPGVSVSRVDQSLFSVNQQPFLPAAMDVQCILITNLSCFIINKRTLGMVLSARATLKKIHEWCLC